MAQSPTLSANEAATLLGDLRHARGDISNRAAGLSWMMWALILMSTAGSLLLLDKVPHSDLSNAQWGMFLAANIFTVSLWAAVGAGVQNLIWQAFSTAPPHRRESWKASGQAFGVAVALVFSNLLMQGVTRSIQFERETVSMTDLHHNLGFAFAMGIGGAIVAAISVLLGARGFRRWPGVLVGIAMLLVGHLTTFTWFPALGIAGPLVAVAMMPVIFLGIGSYYWRQG